MDDIHLTAQSSPLTRPLPRVWFLSGPHIHGRGDSLSSIGERFFFLTVTSRRTRSDEDRPKPFLQALNSIARLTDSDQISAMDKGTQDRFRVVLESELDELKQNLKESADAAAVVELDSSIGRLSRMDAMQSQQMALELRRRQEAQIERIKKAIDEKLFPEPQPVGC